MGVRAASNQLLAAHVTIVNAELAERLVLVSDDAARSGNARGSLRQFSRENTVGELPSGMTCKQEKNKA